MISLDAERAPPLAAGATPVRCPLCGGDARVIYRDHPGYVRGRSYDIVFCPECDASHASPLAVDSSVYDLIYAHAAEIPGYRVYERLARKIASARDPLAHLAAASPTYWEIREVLRSYDGPESLRVLDFGCGLGYLTYSLCSAGIPCLGVDISREAVDRAKARFGDHYLCADLLDDPGREGQFDLVVCTELIEHVEQPRDLLAGLRRLLTPGGALVLTTPNRAAYPADSLWCTDAPPVHLWWLSETAVAALALRSGFASCDFIDLAGCPANGRPPSTAVDRSRPITRPLFDEEGRLCASPFDRMKSAAVEGLKSAGVWPRVLDLTSRLKGSRRDSGVGRTSRTLCAVLRNA